MAILDCHHRLWLCLFLPFTHVANYPRWRGLCNLVRGGNRSGNTDCLAGLAGIGMIVAGVIILKLFSKTGGY